MGPKRSRAGEEEVAVDAGTTDRAGAQATFPTGVVLTAETAAGMETAATAGGMIEVDVAAADLTTGLR